jgi:Lipocalin-like domain
METAMSWKIPSRHAQFLTGGLIASLAFFGPVKAQNAPSSATLQEEIVGTWAVVSQYVDQDGKKVELFGENPNGVITFDMNGYFVGLIQSNQLPKVASNNRLVATDSENRDILKGSLAYFGKYTVRGKKGEIDLHFNGSTYPNWIGMDQSRKFTIKGTRLDLTVPTTTVGSGVGHLVLKRLE